MSSQPPRRRPSEAKRLGKIAAGVLLMLLGPLIGGPLPGPFGFIGFGAGLALVLQASHRARRIYARSKRRWPATGRLLDKCLRWRREWSRYRHARATRRALRAGVRIGRETP